MKIVSHLDMSQLELRNAVVQNLAGAPSSPKEGQIWYATGTKIIMAWNGTAWRPLDAAALTDGSIALSALATNPLARANHTGTQAAATISDFGATIVTYRLDQFAAPTAAVLFNSQRAGNLADPSNPQDAATKAYVDNQLQQAAAGIDSKASVRAVATANVASLSGTTTIDGVSLIAGDRVLLTAQTTASQNGVYVIAAGAWSRATDADTTGEITAGAFWFVEEGTTYGKSQWRCNNTGAITIGTTAITVVQFGATMSYTATLGVQLVGSNFSLLLDTNSGLSVSGTGVKIDTSVVARKFSATITGDGSTTGFNLNPGLGTTDLIVIVKDSSGNKILVDTLVTSATQVTITFGAAPANATTYRVTILG